MERERIRFNLSNINVNATGHDGGHRYIVSNVEYKGFERRLSVFMQNKSDEVKLKEGLSITVEGFLKDDSNEDLRCLKAS